MGESFGNFGDVSLTQMTVEEQKTCCLKYFGVGSLLLEVISTHKCAVISICTSFQINITLLLVTLYSDSILDSWTSVLVIQKNVRYGFKGSSPKVTTCATVKPIIVKALGQRQVYVCA